MSDFYGSIDFLFQQEGVGSIRRDGTINTTGYVNDPNDSGGETNWGITEHTARSYGYTGAMIDMPRNVAESIIYTGFWAPWNMDAITDQSSATAILSILALMGAGGAARVIQRALRDLGWTGAQDGAWGPQTLAGVNQYENVQFIPALAVEAGDRFRDIVAATPRNQTFLAGWINRANAWLDLVTTNPVQAVTEAMGSPEGTATGGALLLVAAGVIAWLALSGRHG